MAACWDLVRHGTTGGFCDKMWLNLGRKESDREESGGHSAGLCLNPGPGEGLVSSEQD